MTATTDADADDRDGTLATETGSYDFPEPAPDGGVWTSGKTFFDSLVGLTMPTESLWKSVESFAGRGAPDDLRRGVPVVVVCPPRIREASTRIGSFLEQRRAHLAVELPTAGGIALCLERLAVEYAMARLVLDPRMRCLNGFVQSAVAGAIAFLSTTNPVDQLVFHAANADEPWEHTLWFPLVLKPDRCAELISIVRTGGVDEAYRILGGLPILAGLTKGGRIESTETSWGCAGFGSTDTHFTTTGDVSAIGYLGRRCRVRARQIGYLTGFIHDDCVVTASSIVSSDVYDLENLPPHIRVED
jgi:hypothetical protein